MGQFGSKGGLRRIVPIKRDPHSRFSLSESLPLHLLALQNTSGEPEKRVSQNTSGQPDKFASGNAQAQST